MTPAERDEVRVIAEAVERGCYGFDDAEMRRWMQMFAKGVRYVPPSGAFHPCVAFRPDAEVDIPPAFRRSVTLALSEGRHLQPDEARSIAHALHATADAAEET